ncbi:hypothetical protein P9E76_00395 [Schinkia azotoformans]|uniref:Uncharacterized protein n=1 Tax=Schinkia azotoformans LMG 9581 TaxID=1131731 RepID=K6DPZ5_SCHAZ|nr:hypothetical protein [Schinkia azotoformans]EKN70404.1 hypothetical protein BAZO_01362 [Schinkia azotoformans LMG 9581]MEC1640107.1 hypothetical protein [Schinkia azotoformans]MEC1943545.1 hypothetical protein [Schinkia azotoformans]
MNNSACQYIEKDPSNPNICKYKTDFEYISYETSEFEEKCFYLEDENILYIRFIYAPDIKRNFPEYKFQNTQLNKFFFLPTHKTREFKHTIKIEEGTWNCKFSDELKEFYTSDMINNLKPNSYYITSFTDTTYPEDRRNYSTSLFILFDKERFDETGEISYESILKLNDVEGLDEKEKNDLILNSGLEICSQIPLYKYLVSFGSIKLNQGILEWEKTLRTDTPEPGSSHVHFFKINKEIESINFQDIADQFELIDSNIFKRPLKRKKSKRRGVLLNED